MSAARSKTQQAADADGARSESDKPESLGEGHISGNLTQDPELRFTPTGRAICKLRVAYSQRLRDDKTGQWHDGEIQYFDVDIWGQQGENCAEYLMRGDRIVAVGEWFKRHYETRQGEKRTSITLTARDVGPSMLFRAVSINRTKRTGPPMGGPPPVAESSDVPPPDEPPPF